MKNKEIFYWSPSLVKIATNQAVIQSAKSILKYNKEFKANFINFFGEYQDYEEDIVENKITLKNFYSKKIFNFLPKYGFFKSRLSFILIFILGFFPLLSLLKKLRPNYLIIHLITSLPLVLILLFNFETKFILRISGFPKLNFLRKFLWKYSLKKIYAVTCPTKATRDYLISLNLIDKEKIYLLSDPIININKINKLKKENIKINKKDFIFSAGRLTKQKNFELMIDGFQKINKKYPNIYLVIAGDGELKSKLINKTNKLGLEKNIIFIGYQKNVYNYMSRSICFLLSSLWEDPGFVIVEAAFCKTPVITSNCYNGPKEIIPNNESGYVFESNNLKSLEKQLNKFLQDNDNDKDKINRKKLQNLKNIKKFTNFRHYLVLKNILNRTSN